MPPLYCGPSYPPHPNSTLVKRLHAAADKIIGGDSPDYQGENAECAGMLLEAANRIVHLEREDEKAGLLATGVQLINERDRGPLLSKPSPPHFTYIMEHPQLMAAAKLLRAFEILAGEDEAKMVAAFEAVDAEISAGRNPVSTLPGA